MSLLVELDAFYLDHRRCGELEAGVDEQVVWFDCECGASMARPADEADGAAGHGSQHDAEHDASARAL